MRRSIMGPPGPQGPPGPRGERGEPGYSQTQHTVYGQGQQSYDPRYDARRDSERRDSQRQDSQRSDSDRYDSQRRDGGERREVDVSRLTETLDYSNVALRVSDYIKSEYFIMVDAYRPIS